MDDEGQSYDCQRCGACCVHLGGYDGNGYVYLDRQEAVRVRRLGLPVVEQALGAKCLAAAPHDGAWGYPACIAFEGGGGGVARGSRGGASGPPAASPPTFA